MESFGVLMLVVRVILLCIKGGILKSEVSCLESRRYSNRSGKCYGRKLPLTEN